MLSAKTKAVIFIVCMAAAFVYVFFIEKSDVKEESSIDPSAWASQYNYDALYPYDEKTNAFLERYNETAIYPATRDNTSKGNIDCKAYVQAGDVYLELIVRDDGYNFATGENKLDTGEDLFTVFCSVVKTIEPSITFDEAKQTWDRMQTETVVIKNMKCCIITNEQWNRVRFEVSYPADKLGG